MTETLGEIARWAVPAAIVFGVTALAVVAAVWALRRARRSPRARAVAQAERDAAGIALVALDDAVEELDLEVELSGALYDGSAPPALRRARMTAQHTRDDAFALLRDLDGDAHPEEIRRVAQRIRSRSESASAHIARARDEHAAWMSAHRGAAEQVERARARAEALRAELGDADALVTDLGECFDAAEVEGARRFAREATDALDEADRLLVDAGELLDDPTRSALTALSAAERALRRARSSSRGLEEAHRLMTDAAQAAPTEIAAARGAIRQAEEVRAHLEPEDAERLGRELRAVVDALDTIEPSAGRRPVQTITELARVRDRLDLALGDARTAQQRLRGARTALPGTLAAARAAVARAEETAVHAGADARVRLSAAQHDLAAARSAGDPVEALDIARRALRHAEDAVALADYDRLASGGRGSAF